MSCKKTMKPGSFGKHASQIPLYRSLWLNYVTWWNISCQIKLLYMMLLSDIFFVFVTFGHKNVSQCHGKLWNVIENNFEPCVCVCVCVCPIVGVLVMGLCDLWELKWAVQIVDAQTLLADQTSADTHTSVQHRYSCFLHFLIQTPQLHCY